MSASEPVQQASQPGTSGCDALADLFARCQGELLGMLSCLTGNAEDARDALQDAFVKCWRRRASLGEIENLRAWVFRVALNAGRDMRATAWRRRRRPLPEDESMVAAPRDNQDDLDRRERLTLVRQALLALRAEEQEVFLLRQNGEMTYDEIAAALNIPSGTVKTRMRLALQKLRGALHRAPEADGAIADES